MIGRRLALLLPLLCTGFLAGCGGAVTAVETARLMGKEMIFGPDVNLTEKSYAAADYLVQQARTYIDGEDVIKAIPLVNIDAPTLSSRLAHVIPAQVGARLAQLGYQMDLSAVMTAADQSFQTSSTTSKTPDHILTGTYRVHDKGFEINLRIVEQKHNRIVGVFDYHIPRSTDVKELAEPEAQIMIIKE